MFYFDTMLINFFCTLFVIFTLVLSELKDLATPNIVSDQEKQKRIPNLILMESVVSHEQCLSYLCVKVYKIKLVDQNTLGLCS